MAHFGIHQVDTFTPAVLALQREDEGTARARLALATTLFRCRCESMCHIAPRHIAPFVELAEGANARRPITLLGRHPVPYGARFAVCNLRVVAVVTRTRQLDEPFVAVVLVEHGVRLAHFILQHLSRIEGIDTLRCKPTSPHGAPRH